MVWVCQISNTVIQVTGRAKTTDAVTPIYGRLKILKFDDMYIYIYEFELGKLMHKYYNELCNIHCNFKEKRNSIPLSIRNAASLRIPLVR